MKSAREHIRDIFRGPNENGVLRTIEARDAEHRAEIERLKGELAEERGLIASMAHARLACASTVT